MKKKISTGLGGLIILIVVIFFLNDLLASVRKTPEALIRITNEAAVISKTPEASIKITNEAVAVTGTPEAPTRIITETVVVSTEENPMPLTGLWASQLGGGDCSSASSPCTLKHAMELVQKGETIHIVGTITTPFVISKSGEVGAPITFSGGIVDTLGSTEQNAVFITGSWIIIDNVEIMHGYDFGIRVNGDYVTIKNSKIHDNVTNPQYRLANGKCDSTRPYGWGSGHRHYIGADFGQLVNNEVYDNCGEGITSVQANDLKIARNYVHDNFSVGIYIEGSQNVHIHDNVLRATNPDYYRKDLPMRGISLGQEEYDWAEFIQIRNIIIDNNLLEGVRGISFYHETADAHLESVSVTNNTFQDVTFPQIYFPNLAGNTGIVIEKNTIIYE